MAGEKSISGVYDNTAENVRKARFDAVWREHRPRIWRLVSRLSGNMDRADDLTQEVSLRAYQAYDGFAGRSNAFTWLYRIAVNVVNRDRERRRETMNLDAPEVTQLCADTGGGPEQAVLRAELAPMVWAALERLPEELRTTLILQVYEQLKYREIAVILNVPIGTVKSRLHSAMLRLREELKDYEL